MRYIKNHFLIEGACQIPDSRVSKCSEDEENSGSDKVARDPMCVRNFRREISVAIEANLY